jgi:anti-sigma regulatory factor (Ser/Thr protein kinase)
VTEGLTFVIRPDAAAIGATQRAVAQQLREAGCAAPAVARAELVIEEVALNAFRHGGAATVTLTTGEEDGAWRLRFEHAGPPFDPTATPAAAGPGAARGEGGLGLVLVTRAALRLRYARLDGGINRFDVILAAA